MHLFFRTGRMACIQMDRPKVNSVYTVVVDTNMNAQRKAPNIATLLGDIMTKSDADGVRRVVLVIVSA